MGNLRGVAAFPLVLLLLLGAGCEVGPSEERLGCLQNCAAYKDGCMLHAMDAAAIRYCDIQSQRCSEGCP